MSEYDFEEIEARWQRRWEEGGAFEVTEDPARPKFYCLEMLPYPSGDIHLGHVRNYSIGDVVARYKRMRGFNVLHPIGWDALGLPAENAAIQRGIHPERWTLDHIATMRKQLKRLGFSYSWSREIATCEPEYYRWNQWFFLRMMERGLAYRAKAPVNWCPKDKTVLANEQVESGECWRCHTKVEEREMDQWFLRITKYEDELIDDMDQIPTWPERVLTQQLNWIGRSRGAEVSFQVPGLEAIRVFTTRIDTIFGATFLVLAPEHPSIDALVQGTHSEAKARAVIAKLRSQDRRSRMSGLVPKEGVFLGRMALNPFSGEKIPVWVGNFVLMGYGTGAVMAVPAHDQRDFEFAKSFGLPLRPVIQPEGGAELSADGMSTAYDGPGRTVNSGEFSGLDSATAAERMAAHASAGGFGGPAVSYRLKDWLISRQRYWGTPIPVVYCEKDGIVPVPDTDLPVVLPKDAPFTGEGGNPLEQVPSFVQVRCPKCGGDARRETDTMDTFVDSSWYFYRYLSRHKDDGPVDVGAVRYWFPIDLYIGGIEHAILHLVYSRFWTKMMRDLGLVTFDEPVTRLFPQGMVHRDGEVMSKSKGNSVAPDTVIRAYGADTLRVFMLFMAPPEMSLEWDDEQIKGPNLFLHRVWKLVDRHAEMIRAEIRSSPKGELSAASRGLRRKVHQTIQKVTDDIEDRIHLNTAISALMELQREISRVEEELSQGPEKALFRDALEVLLLLLSPFAPHMCEELWSRVGRRPFLIDRPWPVANPEFAREDDIEIPVQVNGKVRGRVSVTQDMAEDEQKRRALEEPNVKQHIASKEIVKVVVVPGRLVSVVVR